MILTVVAAVLVVGAIVAVVARQPAHQSSQATHDPTSGRTGPTRAPVSTRTRPVDLGDATVTAPRRWFTAPYRGRLPTVYSPIVFLRTDAFTGPCSVATTSSPASCTTPSYFPPRSRTPGDGLVVLWGHAEFPGAFDRLGLQPGRPVTVDHRPARRYDGKPLAACPPGAVREVHVAVRNSSQYYDGGNFYEMTACLGPGVSALDRGAVDAMIASLRIRN